LGMPDGRYTLGAHPVTIRGDHCVLADGTIAGSMLSMNRAVRNAVAFAGASLCDAVRMATLVPARIAGCALRKGTLEPGKAADMAVLRADFSVRWTVIRGRVVYDALGA